ncbi:MAG: enoyl-CoA hydratase/isomerase family protein [Betaproteobacteria bacterium]|nr:enoyl-CoA hydratase/isomerase family protein [Betaproteobacteria bacterium]MDH5577335.1 enoyl-CoA hydratase/isomerase family protein [Betaproteobacteria bacterium]
MSVLTVKDRGAVRVLTLNRPEKRNALNTELTQALLDALRTADAVESVGCVVLAGAGKAFCAGADVTEFAELTAENKAKVDARAELTMQLHLAIPKMAKPVVTAVHGAALGGGAGLAIAGDLAVMADGTALGYPETRHGIVAAIVMANLVRQAGRKAAFELVALGEPVGAERALALGLVNRVVPRAKVLDEAVALAEKLAAIGRPAMQLTKQLFHEAADLPLEEALARGREANKRMRAFRKP